MIIDNREQFPIKEPFMNCPLCGNHSSKCDVEGYWGCDHCCEYISTPVGIAMKVKFFKFKNADCWRKIEKLNRELALSKSNLRAILKELDEKQKIIDEAGL